MPKRRKKQSKGNSLAEIKVLVVDCQTTGATPGRGSLLELGFCPTRAADAGKLTAADISSYILELPEGEKIPRRITALTGISESDPDSARPAGEAWKSLERSARAVKLESGRENAPAVIHYARFEEPWLRQMHAEHSKRKTFPFEIICTHEISRRLFPELPRRGLRAVSGYLGHVVPELKRAATHVLATAMVWSRLVPMLRKNHGIETFEELREWMSAPPPARKKKIYPLPRSVRLNLPDSPGIYRMRGKGGEVLYLGKATSLRKRVNSYFTKQRRVPEKTLEMLSQVKDVDVTVTASPLEAALLECDEIKSLSPQYNIALRGGERGIWYFSPGFLSASGEPGPGHPIGPVACKDGLLAFGSLIQILGNAKNPRGLDPKNLITMPDEMLPDEEMFVSGFRIFLKENGLTKIRGNTGHVLTGLGTRLWQQHLDERDLAQEEEEEEPESEDDGEKEEWEWTPERVARALEWNVVQSAHLLRRAWWFTHLSESALAWRPAQAEKGTGRLLLIESGRIGRCEKRAGKQTVPVPSGSGKTCIERQKNFDYATYDRLRVLTTELRRITATDNHIELRLGRTASFEREHLAGLLRWV